MQQDTSADVRFADIGNLPSNFFPYSGEFSKLNIRPFSVGELKLLSRAAATKNVESTIKAIDQTIDVPVRRITIGDFYFILMWHKLHSFPKTPLSVAWECKSIVPISADNAVVRDGTHVKVDACNSPNAQLIHQSDIDIVALDDDFAGIPANFDYPRVSILGELLEMSNNPDYLYLVNSAQWIKHGETLEQKFEYLEKLPDISLYEEAEEIQKTVIHGVNEYITIKCSRCGTQYKKRLDLDPVNFFRPCL